MDPLGVIGCIALGTIFGGPAGGLAGAALGLAGVCATNSKKGCCNSCGEGSDIEYVGNRELHTCRGCGRKWKTRKYPD